MSDVEFKGLNPSMFCQNFREFWSGGRLYRENMPDIKADATPSLESLPRAVDHSHHKPESLTVFQKFHHDSALFQTSLFNGLIEMFHQIFTSIL